MHIGIKKSMWCILQTIKIPSPAIFFNATIFEQVYYIFKKTIREKLFKINQWK